MSLLKNSVGTQPFLIATFLDKAKNLLAVHLENFEANRSMGTSRGVFRNLSRGGGLNFFLSPGGAQHPLGPENPMKSIEFTGPGGA